MTNSTQTLTQSGLLAVLLQRQRYRVIQLARRRAHRKRVHAAFGDIFTRLGARSLRQSWSTGRATLEIFHQANSHVSPNTHLHRAPATDSRGPSDPTSRMDPAKWRMSHVPHGSTRYFDAKGDPETVSLSHDTPVNT